MSGSRQGPALDRFRLLAAVLVVCNHTGPLDSLSPTADFFLTRVLARLAVPFFFIVSGYFLAKGQWKHTGRFLRKTLLLYLAAVALYLPLNWYNGGYSPLEWVKKLLADGTLYHLWYFPAVLLGVPVALLTAVYLAFFCPKGLYRVLKPAVELLAGIPSVVYGFFGIVVLVPAVRALGERWDGSGNAMLTASILLAIMILPTIIGVVEPALRAVPTSYYEGALALGATHERSVYTAVVPAAKSGILAGIVLGVGRAMGAAHAQGHFAGRAHADGQHRHRDGLRDRAAPRGADRHGRGAVRVHPAD